NAGYRDIINIDLFLFNKVEEQIERSLKRFQLYFVCAFVGCFECVVGFDCGGCRRLGNGLVCHQVSFNYQLIFTPSHTAVIVRSASSRPFREPSRMISRTSFGRVSYPRRRSCIGSSTASTLSVIHVLHSIQPIPAERQPSFTRRIVSAEL